MAELALLLGHVHLELVAEAEERVGALAVVDQWIEWRQERRARRTRRFGCFERLGRRPSGAFLALRGQFDRNQSAFLDEAIDRALNCVLVRPVRAGLDVG